MRRQFITPFVCSFALLTGCAHYDFTVVRPPDTAGRITDDNDMIVKIDPLEYRLRTIDNRLVLRIYNPTNDAIQLQGRRSAAVDPDGQSHPLADLSIAPSSFGKLILPPIRPHVEQQGPTIGFGIGTQFGSARHRAIGYDDPFDNRPRYLTVVDDDALYWNWPPGDVRLMLVYDRNGKSFTDEFTFRKSKG